MREQFIKNRIVPWQIYGLLLIVLGCDSKGTVPIEPSFIFDGKPLQQASITFIRQSTKEGRASFGLTDDQGVAQLTTFKPLDGVLPGTYRVVVVKAPENAMTFTEEEPDLSDPKTLARMSSMSHLQQAPKRGKRVRTTIPEVYSDPGTTPLKCEVSHDQLKYEFVLSSEVK